MNQKFASLGTALSREEAKKIMGGVLVGRMTHCSTCPATPTNNPGVPSNSVCISLTPNWTCIDMGGNNGLALACSTPTGGQQYIDCSIGELGK